ncbi:MAG: shikimate kinase [Flavobacteriales bacterium]|nr:shikimate kinase [Flavobacteriales bacterium]|tara:strand:+ start:6902 stop:7420 length:519 start_codon:yes stop_codon:yes gene_type:complete
MNFDKIFLIGFMGCGKSTLGRKIANQMGWTFVDLDEYIEKKEGKSIPLIFKEYGETYFRKLETKYLKELIKLKLCVISCGGGTPCFNKNIEIITSEGASVYIKLSPTVLLGRLKQEKEHRPLIADMVDSKLFTYIQKKLNERKMFYEKAEFTFNAESETEESIMKRIHKFLI